MRHSSFFYAAPTCSAVRRRCSELGPEGGDHLQNYVLEAAGTSQPVPAGATPQNPYVLTQHDLLTKPALLIDSTYLV